MKTARNSESGFTAIELLITLIIASMFLYAGYQLYSQVMRDGKEANQAAILSSTVTQRLQEKARSLSGTCVAESASSTTVTENGVGSVTYTTTVSCPNSANIPNLKLVTIEASYDNPVKKVSHALYVK